MTHGAVPEDQRIKTGVTEDLARLSVGIEDVEDLLDDLSAAFQKNWGSPE
jgi:cystathionine beta-lyase/cystathionine gamma-synthase